MGTPDPMKAPRLPSVAPRNMDPRVMQQQAMQKAMMGQQRPQMQEGGDVPSPEEFLNDKHYNELRRLMDEYEQYKKNYDFEKQRHSGIEEAADGGRIGMMYGGDPGFQFEYGGSWADWHDQHRNQMPVEDYIQTKLPKERLPFRAPMAGGGMGRRAFMKLMAGLTALPFVGKGVQKTAPKAIKEVTETVIERGADGMPKYVSDLIEVVKAKGTKDIIEGFKKSDYSTVHSYKGVDVIDDPSGAIRIKKDVEGGGTYTTPEGVEDSFDGITRAIHIEIKPGEYIQKGSTVSDDAAKAVKAPDEYFEGTVRPDMDGKMKDIVEEVDEIDHVDLKKIADEAKDLLKIKKASGGLAHLLGE